MVLLAFGSLDESQSEPVRSWVIISLVLLLLSSSLSMGRAREYSFNDKNFFYEGNYNVSPHMHIKSCLLLVTMSNELTCTGHIILKQDVVNCTGVHTLNLA